MVTTSLPGSSFESDGIARPLSYISWPAVFAGNAVTGGLILVMLPLGAAAGLAMASPYRDTGASAQTIGLAAIIWVAFMYLFSISVGGYVTGRLRPASDDASTDEIRFRDMMSGLVFWGLGMIISAVFTFMTIASTVNTTTSAVTQAVAPAAAEAVSRLPAPSIDYSADALLRGATGTPQAQPPARSDVEVKSEITRILATSAVNGKVTDADKAYIATLVTRQTGISEVDAKARVDQIISDAAEMKSQAAAAAKETADKARKAISQGAFWTAILSLLSGIAAMYSARLGGQHRDERRT